MYDPTIPDRPTSTCGCGFDLIWVNGAWEHDAAPSLWGDDHTADEDAPTGEARAYWDREDLGIEATTPATTITRIQVPDFEMDVNGTYYRAYPEQRDYRIRIQPHTEKTETWLLTVHDSADTYLGEQTLTIQHVDGINKATTTDHSLNAYGDDWRFPDGMEREIYWEMPTPNDHEVRLNVGQISEISEWFDYAAGESVWDWENQGTEWSL